MEIKRKKYELKCMQKISLELIDLILDAIISGVPAKYAAQQNNVAERTFYAWIQQGKLDMEEEIETLYSSLAQSLSKVRGMEVVANLRKIEAESHRGAMWILEHKFWKEFSTAVADKEFNERLEVLEFERNREGAHERKNSNKNVVKSKSCKGKEGSHGTKKKKSI